MSARIQAEFGGVYSLSDSCYRNGDRQFLRQLKTATRAQLRRMLEVFTRLNHEAFDWKRAAVERKLGINRTSFDWLEQDRWWERPGE